MSHEFRYLQEQPREVFAIAWDASGRFEREFALPPARFAEVCGRLKKGQSIAWSFKSDQLLNFNVHYYEGRGQDRRVSGEEGSHSRIRW